MNTKLKIAFTTVALAFSAQAAADITFYEQEGFHGRSASVDQSQTIKNMKRTGFNDRASSVVVSQSRWEVCSDRNFKGQCRVLRQGRYPSLASLGLNDRVSSARPVGRDARVDDRRYPPQRAHMQVTFYEHENFGGRTVNSAQTITDFRTLGFNDLASAVDVQGRSVEVCSDIEFRGQCVVLNPGRYPSVMAMGLNDRISSVREVDTPRNNGRRY